MARRSHVSKWGSSLAVRIPQAIAQQWGVREGSAVEITAHGDQVVLRRQSFDLEDLLYQITPDNLHGEQHTGEAQGKEVW
jgi:antitoxin MazE